MEYPSGIIYDEQPQQCKINSFEYVNGFHKKIHYFKLDSKICWVNRVKAIHFKAIKLENWGSLDSVTNRTWLSSIVFDFGQISLMYLIDFYWILVLKFLCLKILQSGPIEKYWASLLKVWPALDFFRMSWSHYTSRRDRAISKLI